MSMLFPATYSTLCTTALAQLITAQYGLHDVACKLLVRGVGDTYMVTCTAGRYVLRIYRSTHRSLPQIREEIDLLLALKGAGVAVSYPIADVRGATIQPLNAVEGERHAVLFSHAAGQVARLPSEAQLLNLGRETARFHNVSAGMGESTVRWTFDVATTLLKPLTLMKPAFADTDAYTWLCEAAATVAQALEAVDDTNFSKGYCHFDLLPKNFHFEGERVTLFDFDFMGYGWLVNDIMTFWQHLMLEAYAGRMTQAAANDAYALFVRGYREARAISTEELALVPSLSLGFWLFYMGFHTTHDQFYQVSQRSYVDVYTGFLKHIMKLHPNAMGRQQEA